MFNWLLPEDLLKKDPDSVKTLFEALKKAKTPTARQKIVAQALTELKIHAVLEEEIFYPAVRAHVGSKLRDEADEEHYVAKVLIAELDTVTDKNDHRDAKFTVLSESARHHIKEEENEVPPKARELDIDFEALGRHMVDRKKELPKSGIPADSEHAMVEASGGRADSPAATAKRKNAGDGRKSASLSTAKLHASKR